MKKIILFLLAILYVGICKAQLSAADCKYVLEIFCRNYYEMCIRDRLSMSGSYHLLKIT